MQKASEKYVIRAEINFYWNYFTQEKTMVTFNRNENISDEAIYRIYRSFVTMIDIN